MIAARITIDLIMEMRYKFRYLGLHVKPTSELICDNLSVVVNTILPFSNNKNKYISCQIMHVQEAISAGFSYFGHIRSKVNISDRLISRYFFYPFFD